MFNKVAIVIFEIYELKSKSLNFLEKNKNWGIKKLSWIIYNPNDQESIQKKEYYLDFDLQKNIKNILSFVDILDLLFQYKEGNAEDILQEFLTDIRNSELIVAHDYDLFFRLLNDELSNFKYTIPDIKTFCTCKSMRTLCGLSKDKYLTLEQLYNYTITYTGQIKPIAITKIDKLLFCFDFIYRNLINVTDYINADTIAKKHIKIIHKPHKLLPFRKNNKWGFANENKDIIIDYIYDDLVFYSEEYFFIKYKNRWAIIDKIGKFEQQFVYNTVKKCEEFIKQLRKKNIDTEDDVIIVKRSDKKYYYTNNAGNILFEEYFNQAGEFINGLAIVCKDGLYGVVNKQGVYILPVIFNSIFNTGKGILIVNKSSIYDYSGNNVETYDYITEFNDDIAFVCKSINGYNENSWHSYKIGLLSADGKLILPCEYRSFCAPTYRNERVIFINDKRQFIIVNTSGAIERIVNYDNISSTDYLCYYSEKYLILGKISERWLYDETENRANGIMPEREYQVIDQNGNNILPRNNYYRIYEQFNLLHIIEGIRFGIFTMNGTETVSCIYEDILDSFETPYAVKVNDRWGFIDIRENIIVPFIYDEVTVFENKFAIVMKDNLWSIIDADGYKMTDKFYDNIERLNGSIFKVQNNNKWQLLNFDKDEYSSSYFDEIEFINRSVIFIRIGKKWGVINENFNIVLNVEFDELKLGECIEKDVLLLPNNFEKFSRLHDIITRSNFFIVKIDGKRGLYLNSEIILNPLYDEIIIGSRYCIFRISNKWGYSCLFINHKRKSELEYDKIFFNIDVLLISNESKSWEVIADNSGKHLFKLESFEIKDAIRLHNDTFLIKADYGSDIKWRFWNFDEGDKDFYGPFGNISEINVTTNNWIFVKDAYTPKWGIIKKYDENLYTQKYLYDIVDVLNDNYVIACLDGKYGVINKYGCEIVPFKYKLLERANDNFIFAQCTKSSLNKDKWGIINLNGDVVEDFKYNDISSLCYDTERIDDTKYINQKTDSYQLIGKKIEIDTFQNCKIHSTESKFFVSGNKRNSLQEEYGFFYLDDKDIRIGVEDLNGCNVIPNSYDIIKLRKDGTLLVGRYYDYYMDDNGTVYKE